MKFRDPTGWMWGEALELLERADRMHRQFFQPAAQEGNMPCWEPPIDLFDTGAQMVVVVALPGVETEQLVIALDGPLLIVKGQRRLPALAQDALIHCLEIPYGRFERRIALPSSALALSLQECRNGCLFVVLDKGPAPDRAVAP
ncbi:MAG: Hsp20/alpha crystallin family protein [Massilia sp.]